PPLPHAPASGLPHPLLRHPSPLSRLSLCFSPSPPPARSTLFPYTTLFRSVVSRDRGVIRIEQMGAQQQREQKPAEKAGPAFSARSEEHTSELQSRENLVCPPLPEKKNGRAGNGTAEAPPTVGPAGSESPQA